MRFSDEEILRIQNLLQKGTIAEQPSYIKKRERENKNLNIESVTNQSSIFSKNSIILSIIFSPLLGGALLFYNLKVLKKVILKI